jgi:endonuclease/exonuclease/phosphatase family metal-dependent hydrolase
MLVAVALLGACSGDGDASGEDISGEATPADDTSTEEAGSPPATTPGPSGSFSALSYNVAGLPQGINDDQFPEQHTPIISPLLSDYDVVLLQEDFGFYTDVLRADADHEFRTQPHPGPAELNPIDREEAAVGDGLNLLSRLPLGELGREPWTDCGPASADCLALKGFATTTLTLADGVTIDLYTLHLDAGREDSAFRGDNLDQLAAHLEANTEGAVLIGGDWNLNYGDDPDGDQLQGFVEETGLQDVCDVIDCGVDDDVIDRFFFRSGDDVTLDPTSHRFERDTFVNDAGEPLSDHDALAVDWDWSTER